MNSERIRLYEELVGQIGNTRLESYIGLIPNNNRIWIKRECDNPYGGSHYVRVYLELYRHYEESGKIESGMKVLETTSGTAGLAFSTLGKVLGYECHVAIPEGVDERVIAAIEKTDAIMYFTPKEDYVNGFLKFLPRFLCRNKDTYFLNHSMGERKGGGFSNNEVTLKALEPIATECLEAIDIDIFCPASGNGSSILGPGRIFDKEIQIIPFESAQSGELFEKRFPGEYKRLYGIEIGSLARHNLRGTSYPGIPFPHLQEVIDRKMIDNVILLSDEKMDEDYREATGRDDFTCLPHWNSVSYGNFGRTTRAGIVTALEVAKKVKGKNILVIGYSTNATED